VAGDSPRKRILHEPNAVGWIAFLVLVIAIGAAALYFLPPQAAGTATRPATIDQAAR
jgi:hypothetical protein